MVYINFKINDWPREKQDEVFAVVNFLNNEKINFSLDPLNIECNFPEPVDIFVKDINKKFQIVVADFQLYEINGKAKVKDSGIKSVIFHRTKKEIWREYIERPLCKKCKYGMAARGITLLVAAPFDPPWIEWIEKNIDILRSAGFNKEIKKLYFEEIYLVLKNKNILIYP